MRKLEFEKLENPDRGDSMPDERIPTYPQIDIVELFSPLLS